VTHTVGPARRAGGLLLATLVVLAGCQTKAPPATVSGKVTYKNQPLTSGFVNFYMPDKGIAAQGQIDADGNYKLQGEIIAGTFKVYVQPPTPEQLPPGKVSKRPPFNVPPKFQDPAQTPMTKEVKAGANDIPIELTD
jgi:hypothetical protein